jgi:predicted enzyme related to lactoylglutathione lyase
MVGAAAPRHDLKDMTMSEARLVTGVDFVSVATRDLDEAVHFYGDTLGLERSAYVPERGYAEFETGNLTLSIIVPEKMGMKHFTSRGPIALHVEDMAQARARLTDAGVEFQGEPFDTGVCFMSFFSDPNGNALMLHHRYAPRTV